MDLLRFLRRGRNNSEQILAAANEVAQRVEDSVWLRISLTAPTLSRFERKGYVFARAALLVETEVAIAVDRQADLSLRDRQQLTQRALHALLDNINQRLSAPVQLRRAA